MTFRVGNGEAGELERKEKCPGRTKNGQSTRENAALSNRDEREVLRIGYSETGVGGVILSVHISVKRDTQIRNRVITLTTRKCCLDLWEGFHLNPQRRTRNKMKRGIKFVKNDNGKGIKNVLYSENNLVNGTETPVEMSAFAKAMAAIERKKGMTDEELAEEMAKEKAAKTTMTATKSSEEAATVKNTGNEPPRLVRKAQDQALIEKYGDEVLGGLKASGTAKTDKAWTEAVAELRRLKAKYKEEYGENWRMASVAAARENRKAEKKRKAEEVVGTMAWAAKQRREGAENKCLKIWKKGSEGAEAISLGEWRSANRRLGMVVMQDLLRKWEEVGRDGVRFNNMTRKLACISKRWVGHTEGMSEEEKGQQRGRDPFERKGHVVMWFAEDTAMEEMRNTLKGIWAEGKDEERVDLTTEERREDGRSVWIAMMDAEEWDGLQPSDAQRRMAFLVLLMGGHAKGYKPLWDIKNTYVEKAYVGRNKTKQTIVLRVGEDLEKILDNTKLPLSTPYGGVMMWKKEDGVIPVQSEREEEKRKMDSKPTPLTCETGNERDADELAELENFFDAQGREEERMET